MQFIPSCTESWLLVRGARLIECAATIPITSRTGISISPAVPRVMIRDTPRAVFSPTYFEEVKSVVRSGLEKSNTMPHTSYHHLAG
jgi:hypothetical protein